MEGLKTTYNGYVTAKNEFADVERSFLLLLAATSGLTISGDLNETGATFSITLTAADGVQETFALTPLQRVTVVQRLRRVLRQLPLMPAYAGDYSITHDGGGVLSVSRADGVNFSIGQGVVANHIAAATAASADVPVSANGSEAVAEVLAVEAVDAVPAVDAVLLLMRSLLRPV